MVVSGKSAPRLYTDLLDHDPRIAGRNGRNLLADPAPMYRGTHIIRTGPNECHHALMTKIPQTKAPVSDDEKPDASTKYVVSTYCQNCGYHFDITVDFTQGRRGQAPCKLSDSNNPMHHLRLIQSQKGALEDKYNPIIEWYRFVCSGASCPVTVDIKISKPRLVMSLYPSINNAAQLLARGKRVIAEEPERYTGLEPLTPVNVLCNIRQYLMDAKSAVNGDTKRIARRNKKYFLAFADECDYLFEYLDFKAITEESTDPQQVSLLRLPQHLEVRLLTLHSRNLAISGNCHKLQTQTAILLMMF